MKKYIFLASLFSLFQVSAFAADYYWIGGTGNWSQISHWATTSGGSTVHSSVPGNNDNVYFDANSFTANGQTVTLNVAVNIASMSWAGTNYTVTMNGSVNPNIAGDLILSEKLTWDAGTYIYLKGIGNHVLDPGGMSFTKTLYLQDTGSYSLLDSLITTGYVYVQNQSFQSNGHKIYCRTFYVNASASVNQTVDLSTSELYSFNSLYTCFSFSNSNLQLDADSAEFYLIASGGSFYSSTIQHFHHIEYTSTSSSSTAEINVPSNSTIDTVLSLSTTNTCYIRNSINIGYFIAKNHVRFYVDDSIHYAEIYGNIEALYGSDCVFDTLKLLNNSNGAYYSLAYNSTFTVNDSLYIDPGTCTSPVTITSSSIGYTANLVVKNGTVNSEYVNIYWVAASGGASFIANNVVEESSTTGWTLNLLNNPDFYWIGNSGIWDDATNWSFTSGGSPISTNGCYPRYSDNVIFDGNSFNATGQKVQLTSSESCNSMTWLNTGYSPTMEHTYPSNLTIYGNLTTHDSMAWTTKNGSTTYVYFSSDSIQNINFGGLVLNNRILCNGTGTYELIDSIHNNQVIEVNSGTFNSNNHKIYCHGFGSSGSSAATINLGETELILVYASYYSKSLNLYNTNATVDFDSTSIYTFGSSSTDIYSRSITDLHYLECQQRVNIDLKDGSQIDTAITNGTTLTLSNANRIEYLYAAGDVTIADADTIDKAVIYGDFTITTSLTPIFDTLVFYDNNETRTYTFRAGATILIQDSIHFPEGNCTNTHVITSSSNGGTPASRATISKPTGNFYANYYTVNSINGTGGATFTIDNLVSSDANNNGITTNDLGPFNLYWIGGTGYWNDPTNWSLTSGGSAQTALGCLPSENVNAVFDANSFNATGQTVYINSTDETRDLIWDGVTYNPKFKDTISYSSFSVYGKLQLDNSMYLELSQGFTLKGSDTFSIDLAGIHVPNLTLDCDGFYYLNDSIYLTQVLNHSKGSLRTYGHQVRCAKYYSPNIATVSALYLDTSWLICDTTFSNAGHNAFESNKSTSYMMIDADSAILYLRGTANQYASMRCNSADTFRKIIHNASAYYFSLSPYGYVDTVIFNADTYSRLSANLDYNYVESNGKLELTASDASIKKLVLNNDLTLQYDHQIDTLVLTSNTGKRTYTINAGRTLHVTDSILLPSGDCKYLHTITSSTEGSLAYLKVDTGSVIADHFNIFSVYARGNADFSATQTYATDGRDSGWNTQYATIDTMYWVGGTGDWNDITNWSYSSGGSPLTSSDCLPNGRTTVIFDDSSFSSSNQIVTLDSIAHCHSLDASLAGKNPSFVGSQDLTINGDLLLTDSVTFSHTGDIFFNATNTVSIHFGGNIKQDANSNLYFDAEGSFNLTDSLNTMGNVYLQRGSFNTHDFKIHAKRIYMTGSETLTVDLNESIIEIDNYSNNSYSSFTVDHTDIDLTADATTIRMIGTGINAISCNAPNTHMIFNNLAFYGTSAMLDLDGGIADSMMVYSTGQTSLFGADTLTYLFANDDLQIRNRVVVTSALVNGDLTSISGGVFKISHASVYGNMGLGENGTFDTLLLNNEGPSTIHTLSYNDTCFVQDSLYVNSNGCYKTTIRSTNTSYTAYLSMPASSGLFGEYLEVQSISAIGGGDFNIGVNSSDLGGNSGWDYTGSSYSLQLKYKYVCIDTPGISTIQAVPDGYPTTFWWQSTITPYDTFNTGLDTIMVRNPGDYVFVINYGTSCIIEDSIIVRAGAKANGLSQSFSNNANDNSWVNCSNWDQGLIPDSLSDATISAGDTVIIQAGDDAYCKNLTINGFVRLNGGSLHIHGSLVMNGTIIHDKGIFHITGSGQDSITSSSIAVIDSVTFDKSGSILISDQTHITGYADFIRGYVYTTDLDSFIFLDGANSSTGSNQSFVVGPLYKKGENAFTFAIGDSSFAGPISISAPSTSGTSTFKAKYYCQSFNDSVNLTSPIIKVSTLEYWTLDRVNGSGSVRVKLHFLDSSRSSIIDPQYLLVARHDGSDWTSEGLYAYSKVNGVGFIESNYVSSFSPFTFAATNTTNPLPVDFLNISAAWDGNYGIISWSTALERNNDRFEIERSLDGSSFETIGNHLTYNGNSNVIQEYSFTDKTAGEVIADPIYYRIKQVDYDGSSSYSKVVYLRNESSFMIAPNPSRGKLHLTGLQEETTVSLLNVSGLSLGKFVVNEQNSTIDLSQFESGTYFLLIEEGLKSHITKLVLIQE